MIRIAVALTLITAAALGAAPTPIALGQTVEGALAPGDTEPIAETCERASPEYLRDVYHFETLPRAEVEIRLVSHFDGFLYLFAPDGAEIARNDDHDNTRTSLIRKRLGDSGEAIVVVTSYAPGISGAYTFTVDHGGPEAPSAEDAPLRVGEVAEGHLVFGDAAPLRDAERGGPRFLRDAHRFEVRAGQTFHADLTADFDSYLHLTDAAGNVIASNDDGDSHLHSHLTHTPASAGTVRVVVTSFAPQTQGAYALHVTWGEEIIPEEPPAPESAGWPTTATNSEGDKP